MIPNSGNAIYFILIIVGIILFSIGYCLYKKEFSPPNQLSDFNPEKYPFTQFNITPTQHRQLVELLQKTDSILTQYDISYFVIAGSLLGIERYQNRMPWDDDIDIAILDSELENFLQIPWEKYQLKLEKVFFGYKIKYIDSKFPFIDVFIYQQSPEYPQKIEMVSEKGRRMWPREQYYISDIFPLQTRIYDHIRVKCPYHIQNVLDTAYPGWNKTIHFNNSHHGSFSCCHFTLPVNEKTTSQILKYLQTL